MKTKSLIVVLAVLLIGAGFTNAAVVEVAAGTDVLSAAIAAAADGDIIELTTDGGVYAESSGISSISNSITIRAAAGLASKPVIRVNTTDYILKLTGVDSRYMFKGLEIDGSNGTDASVGKYFLRIDNVTPTGKMKVIVDDCVIHHFKDKFIKPYGDCGMDSLVVRNSVLYVGASEGIVFYSGSSSDPAAVIAYGEVSNSTFYDIERECIKGDTYPDGKILVDRITAYNCGDVDGKGMLYFDDWQDVTVKNSIFVKNSYAENFARLESDANIFTHNVMWDIANWEVDNATSVTDTLHADPQFADAANGDFTLGNLALLTYADDGGAVGDPRWVPATDEPTVWEVAAGADVLSAAISAAADGDIVELTSDGGVYTESSKFSSISKSITIRAAEGMINKPILRVATGGDYIFKLTGTSGVFELDGIEVDGTNGTGSAEAKYVMRIDNLDPAGTLSVKVLNCIVHDFNDKVIKPYANTGMTALVVDSSVFYNGASEGITLYSGTSSDPAVVIAAASFTNSTFYGFEREAIKGQTYDQTEVLIDRCTFYDCGTVEKKSMLYFRNMETIEVKNSIFANNQNDDSGEEFVDLTSALSSFHHNVMWNIVNREVGNGTVSDTLWIDPAFTDAANGDFTLGNPALLTYADDGGAVGDPRWAPLEGKAILTIVVEGSGSVALNPPGGVYNEGTVVTMTATPAAMWAFDGWSDNVSTFPPKNPVASITVSENMTVTAYFIPTITKYSVSTNSVGLGHVDVAEFSDFNVEGYFEGDSLVFTAVPDTATWEFGYWVNAAGDSLADDNPLSWIVSADSVFTAKFRSTLPQAALTTSIEGMGSISIDPKPVPGFETYDQGAQVNLTAVAATGWVFSGWKGDVTQTEASITVTLASDMSITAEFAEIAVPNGELLVDDTWDMRDALDFAKNNSQVKLIKLTAIGPFMPTEEDRAEGKLPQLDIDFQVKIVGDPALATKPVIKGWGEGGSEGLFRLRANARLLLENLEIDGDFTPEKKTKYIFRLDDGQEITVALNAENVDFHGTSEVFLKFYALVHADTIRLNNCVVWDIGKEGIFDNAAGTSDYIEISNSTFHHVAREILRTKSQTPEVIIDHVTVDNCGFGNGTEGDKFGAFKLEIANKVAITNTIISNVTNSAYGYSVRFYGVESMMDNCLLFNAPRVDDNDGSILGSDIFWCDPRFVNADAADYTLQDASVAYHLAGDGSTAIGDLKWATSSNITDYVALNMTIEGKGSASLNPEPMAKFYTPGTVVNISAVPDSGWVFTGWSGDLNSSETSISVTMDASKNITANFAEEALGVKTKMPEFYKLSQNYPNPFNPTTQISFGLKQEGFTTLTIYDMLGRQVATLVNRNMPAGYHSVEFSGANLPTGMYIYRLTSGDFFSMKKMMLMK